MRNEFVILDMLPRKVIYEAQMYTLNVIYEDDYCKLYYVRQAKKLTVDDVVFDVNETVAYGVYVLLTRLADYCNRVQALNNEYGTVETIESIVNKIKLLSAKLSEE